MSEVRLIDANALKREFIKDFYNAIGNGESAFDVIGAMKKAIDNAPTAIVESDILYLCDHKKCGENFNCYECNHTSDIRHAINFDLLEFPRSVFVERARHQGRWEEGNHGDYERPDYYFMCSVCKEETDDDTPYCPYCGADMRGDNDDG